MQKFSFDITIEATCQEEAIEKLRSATILMQRLKASEIKKLSEVVKNDPVKTALAKKALGL